MSRSKLLVLACLSIAISVGCAPVKKQESGGFGCSLMSGPVEYRVVRVRGCEYVVASGGNEGIAHAGDCDNPIHAKAIR